MTREELTARVTEALSDEVLDRVYVECFRGRTGVYPVLRAVLILALVARLETAETPAPVPSAPAPATHICGDPAAACDSECAARAQGWEDHVAARLAPTPERATPEAAHAVVTVRV